MSMLRHRPTNTGAKKKLMPVRYVHNICSDLIVDWFSLNYFQASEKMKQRWVVNTRLRHSKHYYNPTSTLAYYSILQSLFSFTSRLQYTTQPNTSFTASSNLLPVVHTTFIIVMYWLQFSSSCPTCIALAFLYLFATLMYHALGDSALGDISPSEPRLGGDLPHGVERNFSPSKLSLGDKFINLIHAT